MTTQSFPYAVLGLGLALFLAAAPPASSQEIAQGHTLPTRGTYRILVLLAEVDYSQGPCPGPSQPLEEGPWVGTVPGWAASLFEPTTSSPTSPSLLTALYHQASFGAYQLLGDYYDQVFTIPCHEMRGGFDHRPVLERLAREVAGGADRTAAGLSLSDFDLWSLDRYLPGEPKPPVPNRWIDSVYVLWRNNRFLTGSSTRCQSGYAVHSARTPIQIGPDIVGVETVASYNACYPPEGITSAEHMHGLFGGNQWHSGGGAGTHATFAIPAVYGLTAQAKTMLTVNAWDRWMLEWEHPEKSPGDDLFITVGDRTVGETPSDVSIDSHPNGASFVLRDFLTTGDAVRIALPHLDWRQTGDVQNQYLWLENRRMKSRLDRYYFEACADRGAYPEGTPGIYAYLQVGKDRKTGPGLYGAGGYANPNHAASWIFPVTPEGRHDRAYRPDLLQPADPSMPCNWGNENLPFDPSQSLPNPFTGLSDLDSRFDSNADGVLGSGDHALGLSRVKAGQVVHDFHVGGDWRDAFGPATGAMEIALDTNPAAVPVYTHRHPGSLAATDNRTIWLNGLAVRIEETNDPDELRVTIRWDDYTVAGDLRWTGDIRLSRHDFDPSAPSLVLSPGAVVTLDQGLSPIRPVATNGSFTDPTLFTALSGSRIRLEPGSTLRAQLGSELRLTSGSVLEIEPGARVVLGDGGRLVVEDGAEVVVRGDGRIDVEPGGELALGNRTSSKGLTLTDTHSKLRVAGTLSTRNGADLTFRGAGFLRFEAGNRVDVSPGGAVSLAGSGPGHVLVSIAPDAVVTWIAGRVFLSNGGIDFGHRSRLEAVGTGGGISQALLRDMRLRGDGIELHARSFRRVLLVRSEVEGLERGIVLSDMPSALPSILTDVRFSNCETAVTARDLRALVMNRLSTFTCLDGIDLRRIGRASVNGSALSFHDTALRAEDVDTLIVSGGIIEQSGSGVLALRSDVEVRGGAVIRDNLVGIDAEGEATDLVRVSVGETGCETSIVHNETGIRFRDAELALDAVDHSCAGGACAAVRPNRFEGNRTVVAGCYTGPSPSEIRARGNYWGGGAPPLSAIRVGSSCHRPGGFLDVVGLGFYSAPPTGCHVGGPADVTIDLPRPVPANRDIF